MSECIKKEIPKIFRCTTFLPNVPKERAQHPKVSGILKKLMKTKKNLLQQAEVDQGVPGRLTLSSPVMPYGIMYFICS